MDNYTLITVILLIIFYYIGLKFPDIDLKIKGLGHRSIVTHSPLVSIMLMFLHKSDTLILIYKHEYDVSGIIIGAFSLGIVIHILYDLVPKKFIGSALIKFPYSRQGLTKQQTIIFMITTAAISSMISVYYFTDILYLYVGEFLILTTLIIKRNKERGFFIPVILFCLIFLFCIYFRNYVIIHLDLLF